jgi:large subunit ribosomal protein L22
MNSATAKLYTYRQSPRKVRLLADLVRGKKVDQAISTLRFANKRAAEPVVKLIQSAAANAKNLGMNADSLVVSGITVNAGQVLKRSMPMSRGRAFPIGKRTSHVIVTVSEGEAKKPKAEKAPKAKAKTTKN